MSSPKPPTVQQTEQALRDRILKALNEALDEDPQPCTCTPDCTPEQAWTSSRTDTLIEAIQLVKETK